MSKGYYKVVLDNIKKTYKSPLEKIIFLQIDYIIEVIS